MVRLLNIQRRELRASGRVLAPAPPKPLVVQADVPHELVGATFTYVSRDGVSQTCSIHRSGHDADGQVFFVTFETIEIEVNVSKTNLLSLLERKVDSDQVPSLPVPSSRSSSSSVIVIE
jgi:hypothetical protein